VRSDAAIIGLMGKHILKSADSRPIFGALISTESAIHLHTWRLSIEPNPSPDSHFTLPLVIRYESGFFSFRLHAVSFGAEEIQRWLGGKHFRGIGILPMYSNFTGWLPARRALQLGEKPVPQVAPGLNDQRPWR
jgi:hypothetical protein